MSQMPPPPPGTPPDLAIQTNNSLYLLLGVYGYIVLFINLKENANERTHIAA